MGKLGKRPPFVCVCDDGRGPITQAGSGRERREWPSSRPTDRQTAMIGCTTFTSVKQNFAKKPDFPASHRNCVAAHSPAPAPARHVDAMSRIESSLTATAERRRTREIDGGARAAAAAGGKRDIAIDFFSSHSVGPPFPTPSPSHTLSLSHSSLLLLLTDHKMKALYPRFGWSTNEPSEYERDSSIKKRLTLAESLS